MLPYIVAFALTALLAYAAGRKAYEDASALKRCLLALCICAPVVLLAALRDYSIGTDVLVYGKSSFELACSCSFPMFHQLTADDYGIGYIALCWVVSNAFDSLPVFLGAVELFAFLPVVLACFKLNAKYAWVGISAFLLLFYGGTLNYLRQGMALGFVLLSVACLLKRERKSCLVLFVVAVCMHQTAILAIPMYLLCLYYLSAFSADRDLSKQGKILVNGIACIASVAVVAFGRNLVVFFSSAKDSYAAQVSRLGTGGVNIAVTAILLLFVLLLYMHAKSKSCRSSRVSECLVLLVVIGFLLRFLTVWQAQLERVALFYLACCALALPILAANLKDRDRAPFVFGSIAIPAVYFFVYYIYLGYSEICPFVINGLLF